MPETSPNAGRILILEDEKPLLDIIVTILESRGWSCVSTRDGQRTIELARTRGPFDAALLDLHAGGSDGLEIAASLRSEHGDLPVILMSGTSNEDFSDRMRSIGRAAFLRKPFSIGSLEAALSSAVGR